MVRQPDFDDDDRNADLLLIGTRGSPLALAQARLVAMTFLAASGGMAEPPELKVIRTTGDAIQDKPLADAGGKGLFTKEIDEALLAGAVDLAVHSGKDLPTELPAGIAIAAVLPREDPRDVLFGAESIAALKSGARLGTSSLRRSAQVRHLRPDVAVVPLRGNVETRLRKLRDGVADATLLAFAGLRRLDLGEAGGTVLATDVILPAVAQGAIVITCRADDVQLRATLALLNHHASARAVTAERAMLAVLDGSCRTPIAGLAELADGMLTLRAAVLAPDGSRRIDSVRSGPESDAEAMGRDAGAELRARAGPGFFAT